MLAVMILMPFCSMLTSFGLVTTASEVGTVCGNSSVAVNRAKFRALRANFETKIFKGVKVRKLPQSMA